MGPANTIVKHYNKKVKLIGCELKKKYYIEKKFKLKKFIN